MMPVLLICVTVVLSVPVLVLRELALLIVANL